MTLETLRRLRDEVGVYCAWCIKYFFRSPKQTDCKLHLLYDGNAEWSERWNYQSELGGYDEGMVCIPCVNESRTATVRIILINMHSSREQLRFPQQVQLTR